VKTSSRLLGIESRLNYPWKESVATRMLKTIVILELASHQSCSPDRALAQSTVHTLSGR
jgi:hypothetical protein